MPVRIVNSNHNARLKQLRRALANPGRELLAGIEGPHLLEEALRARLRIDCVFAAQGSERLLDHLPLPPETDILLLPKELLRSALATETPQPLAALIALPDWTWSHLLGRHRKRAPLVVVLAGIQDPGNLGTILRAAEAFGTDGVIALPGTVNAWNPKAVRASAGSVFRVPILAADVEECFTRLREADIKTWTTALRGAEPADRIDLARPTALLIGNEGSGVPKELAALCDGAVTIPCPGAVESLNAAVAAGVLLYEASRQRAAKITSQKGGGSAR